MDGSANMGLANVHFAIALPLVQEDLGANQQILGIGFCHEQILIDEREAGCTFQSLHVLLACHWPNARG